MRYRVQVLGWTLIWSGIFVFGYLAWQLWVTDWINAGIQEEAAQQLEQDLARFDPVPETTQVEEQVVTYYPEEPVPRGNPFGFISIPAIGVNDVVIYEGVDRETLKNGPGHMTTTPLPGQPGNAVMSGHRTTYGRPFFDFDLLKTGHEIEVRTSVGTHVYAIREMRVVAPTDVWVTNPRNGGWLTLTTCEPKFSSRQRLVVWAEMTSGPNYDFIELQS
jgi:sortase A